MAEQEISDFHVDYDLEDIFHRQLKVLDLDANATSHSDTVGDHLPEWLIGVIIVVIMLIVAFFAMVVTSIQKKKNILQGEISRKPCDDLESGSISLHGNGETLQVTSFIYNTDAVTDENNSDSTSPPLDAKKTSNHAEGDELTSYTNPLFIEDDEEDHVVQNLPGTSKASEHGHSSGLDYNEPGTTHNGTSGSCRKQKEKGNYEDEHYVVKEDTSRQKQPAHAQRRFSRLMSTGTKKEILTEAVVENSVNLDPEKGSKQRRKYLQKIKVSNQAHGVKRDRGKSVTSAQEEWYEVHNEPADHHTGKEFEEATQNCPPSKLSQFNPTPCCSDSGVDVSTNSCIRPDKTGDLKRINAAEFPNVHQIQMKDHETEGIKEDENISKIALFDKLKNNQEVDASSIKPKYTEASLERSGSRSIQPFKVTPPADVAGESSLSKVQNGIALSKRNEESDESENSSASSISLNTLCALPISDHPEHISAPHCSREMCRDDQGCFHGKDKEELSQQYKETTKKREFPSSTQSSCSSHMLTNNHTLNGSENFASLTGKSNGTKDQESDIMESFAEPHYSTNL